MPDLINIKEEPVKSLLSTLLQDKTTKKNIIWATDIYSDLGPGYSDKNQLTTELLLGRFTLQPRIAKSLEEQQQRTRTKAEVMTPVWICNRMNNLLDEQWFDRCDVFNHENEDHSWEATEESIVFSANSWQSYVDSRRLEITCGEAPYLVSRYDTTTGELISPLSRRIGILDRKLRVVNENTETEEEWLTWAERAIQSSYGYEYQGDSLLIARINILLTYWEYYLERWRKEPSKGLLQHIGNIIAWNIWQMDGLKDTVPLGKPFEEYHQISLLDLFAETEAVEQEMTLPCQVHNWRDKSSVLFMECKRRGLKMSRKLFDYVIGNPPYQESAENTSDKPVYDRFMEATFPVADRIELITPARFLFNAGKTPTSWNEKMLADPHFKVLYYEANASSIFPNTDIKGGVAITYHNNDEDYGAIGIFTDIQEKNAILHKVINKPGFQSLSEYVYAPESYKFTAQLYKDKPEIRSMTTILNGKVVPLISNGHDFDVTSNIFDKLGGIVFFEKEPTESGYIQIIGRKNNERCSMWIHKKYICQHPNLDKYKLLFSKANGSGKYGETIALPIISKPSEGHTQTFISIGNFDHEEEAKAVYKYVQTKFARALLGILKVTQDNKKSVWKYVPVMDFTTSSDIDWSKSIRAIDIQLYKKYGLSEEEIAFIESHVKEME